MKFIKLLLLLNLIISLNSCGIYKKTDARDFPPDPKLRVKKNMEEGKGFKLLDLGKEGIRVNSIAPGYIKTKMTSKSWVNKKIRKERAKKTILGRWGETSDLVGPLLFLASDSSSYITGHCLVVDGGWITKGL